MKIFCYTTTQTAPFEELFTEVLNLLVFSNAPTQQQMFVQQPEAVKVALTGVHPDDDKLLFIPASVKIDFLTLLLQQPAFEKVQWEQWVDKTSETSRPAENQLGLLDGDPLLQFYRTMEIPEVLIPQTLLSSPSTQVVSNSSTPPEPEVSFGNSFFQCLGGQLLLLFQGLKQALTLFDPMQGGMFFVVLVLVLLITAGRVVSEYRVNDQLNKAEQALQQGQIEDATKYEKSLEGSLGPNNPVSVALKEIEMAKSWGGKEASGNLQPSVPVANIQLPLPTHGNQNSCYIVQKNETLQGVTEKFYEMVDDNHKRQIMTASIRERGNQRGIWNISGKIDPLGTNVIEKTKLSIGWELVIPAPTGNMDELAKCRFK